MDTGVDMATNDIKAFAAAGGANVLTQAEYQALAALSTGFTSGKASAKEVNKAIRQATLVAAALAQFVSDRAAVDVLDDGNVAGLATKILEAVNKTSQPLDATLTAIARLVGAANKLPYFDGADTAALTDLTQVGRDIIGKNSIDAVVQYLKLNSFHSDPNFSSVSSPTAKVFFFVTDSGDWGVQDASGTPLSLPMDRGGSGANTQLGARINLQVQALTSGEDLTTLSSPTAQYFFYIDDTGAWGVQDNKGNARPLSVAGGGSGESTLPATKIKLGLGAFNTTDEYSSVSSPTANVFLFIQDNGSWGLQDAAGNSIPLPMECGGTGERTLLGARVKLGVDVVGKTNLLTTLSSPDASRFLFITNGTSWGLQTSSGAAIPLPLASGGLGAVTPEGGRTNLGLGTAATKNVGTARDDVMTQGASIFWSALRISSPYDYNTASAFLSTYQQTPLFPGTGQGTIINAAMESNTKYSSRWLGDTAGVPYFQASIDGTLTDAFKICAINKTVTADTNGFIKLSSPIVHLYGDGRFDLNEESEGLKVTRQSEGVYLIEGCIGLNSDAAWGGPDGGFEVPLDRNKQALIWLDYEVQADGSVLVKTYHRTYSDAPAFARNERDGYKHGDPIDIPAGQFLSVRVEMPADSIYNLAQKAALEQAAIDAATEKAAREEAAREHEAPEAAVSEQAEREEPAREQEAIAEALRQLAEEAARNQVAREQEVQKRLAEETARKAALEEGAKSR